MNTVLPHYTLLAGFPLLDPTSFYQHRTSIILHPAAFNITTAESTIRITFDRVTSRRTYTRVRSQDVHVGNSLHRGSIQHRTSRTGIRSTTANVILRPSEARSGQQRGSQGRMRKKWEMLSRFVTTSQTRIINPRNVVPCTLYLLVITASCLSVVFSACPFLALAASPRCGFEQGGCERKKHLRLFLSFYLRWTRTYPSPRRRTRPNQEHPAIFLSRRSPGVSASVHAHAYLLNRPPTGRNFYDFFLHLASFGGPSLPRLTPGWTVMNSA